MESVILTTPVLLLGYIAALVLGGFALIKKAHVAVSVISVLIFIATTAYALLLGANLYETGAVATVFFLVNLIPLWKKGGDE